MAEIVSFDDSLEVAYFSSSLLMRNVRKDYKGGTEYKRIKLRNLQ